MILLKLAAMITAGGMMIISDCSRINFWPLIIIANPFAPSITWNIHQSPYLWLKLLEKIGFVFHKLTWTSPNRLGLIGKLILGNKYFSFFRNSHFNLYVVKG